VNGVPRVTVVVLQRETFAHTERSIESAYATTKVPFRLVYVDAGSPAPVRRAIAAAAARHGFAVLRRPRFLTPNEARNLALANLTTELVVFIDNDVIFAEGWLEALVACADETGAEIVGPLVCIGEPAFERVHVAGGMAHIEETAAGRAFHETHKFVDRQLADVAAQLVREPTEMVEFHCMLVRRSVFAHIGAFDERLRSASEHLVRRSGGTVFFEPGAVVNQLLPRPFPRDLRSLPFFLQRWSPRHNASTIEHFRTKWNLQRGDRALAASLDWLDERRDLMFVKFQPARVRHGLRLARRFVLGGQR
jgi:glycosyltransferase involved in cell wall biosynthesis